MITGGPGYSFHFDANCGDNSPIIISACTVVITFVVVVLAIFFVISKLRPLYSSIVRLISDWRQAPKLTPENIQFLKENVSVPRIMTDLLSKQILTVMERNRIENDSNKVTALVHILVTKDHETVCVFNELVEEIYPGYRRGKGMSVKHKTALLNCRGNIVKDLESKEICSMLYSRGILNYQDKEWIEAASTRVQQAERLLDILPGKGDNAFLNLVEVMKEHNSSFLGEMLLKECQKFGRNDTGDKKNERENEKQAEVHRGRIKIAFRNAFDHARERFSRKSQVSTNKPSQAPSNETPKAKKKNSVLKGSSSLSGKTNSVVPKNKSGNEGSPRSLMINQKGWNIIHIGTRVSTEQLHAALKNVLYNEPDLHNPEKVLQAGEINDIISELDSNDFYNFMEVLRQEIPNVQITQCPYLSENDLK